MKGVFVPVSSCTLSHSPGLIHPGVSITTPHGKRGEGWEQITLQIWCSKLENQTLSGIFWVKGVEGAEYEHLYDSLENLICTEIVTICKSVIGLCTGYGKLFKMGI